MRRKAIATMSIFIMLIMGIGMATAFGAPDKETIQVNPITARAGHPVELYAWLWLTPDVNITLYSVDVHITKGTYDNITYMPNCSGQELIASHSPWYMPVSYTPPSAGKYRYQFDVICNDTTQNIKSELGYLNVTSSTSATKGFVPGFDFGTLTIVVLVVTSAAVLRYRQSRG